MKKKNVCLIGLGTVGFGVYKLLVENKSLNNYNIYAVCDKVISLDLLKELKDVIIYRDYLDVLKDDNVDIVVEMIGGINPAYEIILNSLKRKKSVVTSNKEVVCKYLEQFVQLAKDNGVCFLFEASVGGGIPIIKNLCDYSMSNKITSIEGIVNGSTNYLLTKIQGKKCSKISLKDAFQEAYEKGFLEKDPTNDLKGFDISRKIAILSSIAYHTYIDYSDVYCYSLETINDDFINYINHLGYTIKYVVKSEIISNDIELVLEPIIYQSSNNIICNVDFENNIINVNGKSIGCLSFIGKGAGRFPTATAVLSDIIEISNNIGYFNFDFKKRYTINNFSNDCYLLQVKDVLKIDKALIDKVDNCFIYTKEISKKCLMNMLNSNNIIFYARINE